MPDIASVRNNTAMALGHMMDAYGEEAVPKIAEKLTALLPRAKDQPADSTLNKTLENVTSFGVAQKRLYVYTCSPRRHCLSPPIRHMCLTAY